MAVRTLEPQTIMGKELVIVSYPLFGVKDKQVFPEAARTSVEGILGDLKPAALQPLGNFLSQVT